MDTGEGGRGGDRGGGHMQQVVRFSKPIEIDGFPIPWQTLSLSLSPVRFALADELTIHRSFYRYCSEIEGETDARVGRAWKVDGEERGSLRLLLLHFHLVTASRFDTLYKLSNVKLFASPSYSLRYTHRSDPLA